MKFCFKCGKELDDNAKYCRFCGEEQVETEPVINESKPQHLQKKPANNKRLIGMIIGIAAAAFAVTLVTLFVLNKNDADIDNKEKMISVQESYQETEKQDFEDNSEESTPEPTKEVTKEPTKEVTKEPTKEVTKEPTKEVTKEPTIKVVKVVTKVPTTEPTIEPTIEPTQQPEERTASENEGAVQVMYASNSNGINVRSQPSHDSSLVATLGADAALYYYGQSEYGYGSDGELHLWYYIQTDSEISGWVRSDLLIWN